MSTTKPNRVRNANDARARLASKIGTEGQGQFVNWILDSVEERGEGIRVEYCAGSKDGTHTVSVYFYPDSRNDHECTVHFDKNGLPDDCWKAGMMLAGLRLTESVLATLNLSLPPAAL